VNRKNSPRVGALALGLLLAPAAWASALTGAVKGPDGAPVANAFVTAKDASRKMSVTVLTDAAGRYRIDDLFPAEYVLRTRKPGFADGELRTVKLTEQDGQADLQLAPDDGTHLQMPGAAWLNALPNETTKAAFVSNCAGLCHDPASPIAHAPRDADAWEAAIERMRHQSLAYSTHLPMDAPEVARWLAKHRFGTKPAPFDPYAKAANVATTARITEYQVGDVTSWAHDIAIEPRTGVAWVGDYAKDELVAVDPRSGEQKVYPVPIKGAGAHTLNFDRDGRLWITLQHAAQVATFDTRTAKWRFYPGFPPGSLNHSFALDSEGYVEYDADGRIVLTLWGNNRLAFLHPDTGKVTLVELPGSPTDQPYGIAWDSRGVVWYTKYTQNVMGFYDPKSGEKKEWTLPREHSGPHRMHIDNRDNLWIPLSGYGTVLRYNTRDGSQKEFALPDADTFPYASRYDSRTDRVWVTGNGGNAIYALHPETGKATTFRIPSMLSYGRMVSIDYATGDVWTALSSYPNNLALREHSELVRIHGALGLVR
jgi:virginiamycin B lyase